MSTETIPFRSSAVGDSPKAATDQGLPYANSLIFAADSALPDCYSSRAAADPALPHSDSSKASVDPALPHSDSSKAAANPALPQRSDATDSSQAPPYLSCAAADAVVADSRHARVAGGVSAALCWRSFFTPKPTRSHDPDEARRLGQLYWKGLEEGMS